MEVEALGGMVLAIADTVAEALKHLADKVCDGAVLDMDLRGEPSKPVADRLSELAVPYVLTTGYSLLPDEQPPAVPRFTKPFLEREVLSKLSELIDLRNARPSA